jgi:hypothetical protein
VGGAAAAAVLAPTELDAAAGCAPQRERPCPAGTDTLWLGGIVAPASTSAGAGAAEAPGAAAAAAAGPAAPIAATGRVAATGAPAAGAAAPPPRKDD